MDRYTDMQTALVRGERHCTTSEGIDGIAQRCWSEFVFDLADHAVLLRQAAPGTQDARWLHQQRTALAQAHGERPPASRRMSEEFASAAASWSQPWRFLVTAAVMAAGDNPRCGVTSREAPTPPRV
jgi:hypothetical protein